MIGLYRSNSKNLIYSIIAIGLLFLFVEILLRIAGFSILIENESLYDSVLGDYKPNQNLINNMFPELKHHIYINSHGLRGKEFGIEKKPSIVRILLLGDSNTYGARVSNEETHAVLLENILNKHGEKYEVINAGHSSYTIREEYEYFTSKGYKLNPDIIVIEFNPTNDLIELSRQISWRDYLRMHNNYEPFKSILKSTAFYNFFLKTLAHIIIKTKTLATPQVDMNQINILSVEMSSTEQNLLKIYNHYIIQLLNNEKTRSQKILFVLQPSYEQLSYKDGHDKYQRELISFLKANNVGFINLLPYFRIAGKSTWLMPMDNHPSPAGHLIMAKELAKIIPQI